MTEEKETAAGEDILTFSKPYRFEGKEYTGVDLSGFEKLTVKDLVDTQKELFQGQETAATILCETTTAFARALLQKAEGRAKEFYSLMPRRLWRQVKQAVLSKLGAKKENRGQVLVLDAPYSFNGKEYTEIDLSALVNVTVLDETEAENRLAREGFVITENSLNYLYACFMAGEVTGLGEEFFLGLPVREGMKLKNLVSDESFFG